MKSGNQQFQQTFEFVHHLLQTVVQTSESISFASTASFLPLQVSSSECSGKWTFEEHINKKFYLSHYLRPFQSTICNSIWKMKCLCFLISELEVGFQFPVNVGILSWYGLHMCFVCLLLFILFFVCCHAWYHIQLSSSFRRYHFHIVIHHLWLLYSFFPLFLSHPWAIGGSDKVYIFHLDKIFFCLILCNCPVVVLCVGNHILHTEASLSRLEKCLGLWV